MSAATDRVQIKPYDTHPIPTRVAGTMAAAAVWKKGWLLGFNAAGLLVPFTATRGLTSAGLAEKDEDNTSDDGRSANAVAYAHSFLMKVGDEFLITDPPCVAYGTDNQTFQKTGGNVSPGGVFIGLDPHDSLRAIIWVGPVAAALAAVMLTNADDPSIARNVVFANVADLTAYTVAASTSLNDNVLNVETDVVALVAQTTTTQNGLYRVGAVAAGVAPLTRIGSMPTGMTLPNGMTFEVAAGSVYGGSTWKAMSTTTGGWKVGTNDPVFYPRSYRQTITLASGTYTIGVGSTATPDEPLFLFSTTTSTVTALRNTAGTSTATTGGYAAPVASRVAGKAGTAVVLVQAQVAAGTISNADVSTLDVLVTNW